MSPNRKVLLVDDDPDLLVGVEARLHAAGYETLSANNGREGLAAANSGRCEIMRRKISRVGDN